MSHRVGAEEAAVLPLAVRLMWVCVHAAGAAGNAETMKQSVPEEG